MRKELYDLDISRGSKEEKLKKLELEFGISIQEVNPLIINFKGKLITNLKSDNYPLITLIDNQFILINDNTEFRNIHAYDLDGNWLWDVEGCNNRHGKPVHFFYDVCDTNIDENGRRMLQLSSYPEVYETDLMTGKGTRIVEIFDDTDAR